VDRPTFQIWRHDEPGGEEVYFLALLAPPAVPEPGAGIAREVILLVDHSGSMGGAKWSAADWAVKKFLAELTEGDRFNLGLFHDSTRWFARTPQPASPDTVARAVQFLEEHRDSGGTALGPALEQALRQQRAPGEIARHVLVLTDAEVTDEGRILRLADAEAERDDRRRVSVLCIDAAPNADLAVELAERGGGVARFLTSDPEQEDITTALDEVLADWAQPLLTGLQMEVSRPAVQCVGRKVQAGEEEESSRIDLGDLPTGRTLWLAGRFPRTGAGEVTIRVTAPPRREVKTRRVDLTERQELPAIRALFGARRVLALEHLAGAAYSAEELTHQLQRLGYERGDLAPDTDTSPRVYAENIRTESEAQVRKLLVRESLAFGLLSSETAFVAVRTEPGKPVEETVVVANALPQGWSEGFLGRTLLGRAPAAMYMLAMPDVSLDAVSSPAEGVYGSPPPAMLRKAASMPASSARKAGAARPRSGACRLFSGVPSFEGGRAVLFDTARAEEAVKLSGEATISAVRVGFPRGAPDPARLDPGLTLLLFVDDLSQPRAKVRLTDLLRQGNERPLNLRLHPGQRLQVVLQDPAGAWVSDGPLMEVELALA
jgi:Ca-activated chloride channel family protein